MPIPLAFTPEMIYVLLITASIIIFIIFDILRIDLIAVLALAVLGITQILPNEDLFAGFSSDAVISLIAVMIIAKGLEKTGMVMRLSNRLLRITGNQRWQIISVITFLTGLSAAFIRSLGAVALYLPIVTKISQRKKIPKSKILMPMAFCSILGGTMTMIGTGPLIILNSLIEHANDVISEAKIPLKTYHLFSVFPIGATLLITGILYWILIGAKLLPEHELKEANGTKMSYFKKTYKVGGKRYEIKITQNSLAKGLTLKQIENELATDAAIVAIYQEKKMILSPMRTKKLQVGDYIAVVGEEEDLKVFTDKFKLNLNKKLNIFADALSKTRAGLVEAVIPPGSHLIGTSLDEIHMRKNYGLQILSLVRGENIYRGKDLKKQSLKPGDTLGIFSDWENLTSFDNNKNAVLVTSSYPKGKTRPEKTHLALGFSALSFVLMVVFHISFSVSLLVGAVGMVLAKVISLDEAYSAVSWNTIFLLAGLIPLGIAFNQTGLAQWISVGLIDITQWLPIWSVQAILAIIATLLALVITNVGVTVLMVPIAINIAISINQDPRAWALLIALAASNTFLLPTHHVNAFISGPGNYQIKDFLRIGGGMTIIYLITLIITVNLFL